VSDELADRVAEALARLDARADGHLPLPVRRAVRVALGPGETGHRRRFALARRCAESVLGDWREERPHDSRPDELIALAERVLAGAADGEHASRTAVELADAVYELLDEEISEPALNAALAADRLVTAARWDEDAERLDEPQDDEDLDAFQWETAFYASMVGAPSLPKMGIADHAEPRRAFWRWYLEQAVPAAHRSH
jgi:immunity protein Imm5 of predicted polymorphic toxin system